MAYSNLRKFRLRLDSAQIRQNPPIFSHWVTALGYIFSYRRKLVLDLRATYAQMLIKGVYIAPAILNLSLAACGLPVL